MTPRYVVNRRRFLKSLGMAVPAAALPVLRGSPAFGAPTFPRLAVLWYPNGTIQDMFWPSGPGANYTVPAGGILEPLMAFRSKLNVLKGINANSTDAGPGLGPPEGRRRRLDLRARGQGQHERRQQQPVGLRRSDLGRSVHRQQVGRHDPSQDAERRA